MAVFDEEPDEMEDDELSGFQVVDREKLFAAVIIDKEEETIASPIPENEQKALVFDADFDALKEDMPLALGCDGDGAYLTHDNKKVCALKAAFAAKLKETRGGQYARITVCSLEPPMIRLQYSSSRKKGYDVLIPAPQP